MIAALVYFLVVMLAMGFSAWRLLGIEEEDVCAKAFLWLATGIMVFVLAGTVLGFVGQANWVAYLAVAAAMVGAAYWKDNKAGVKYSIRIPALDLGWKLVCLIFIVHLYVYASGAFSYQWLEDDDPWEHAAAAHYVSLFGSYIQPADLPLHYLAPYPPFYDVLMGVLFQIDTSSLQFTLKFFNALLVSLTIPLFYCCAKTILDGRTALWATFIIAILPSFMSHFIWAQTLAMVLALLAFYFIEKHLREDGNRALMIVSALSLGAVLMTQPSVAAIIFVMAALYIGLVRMPVMIANGNKAAALKDSAAVPLLALVLALLLFWGPMFAMYGMNGVLNQMGLSSGFVTDKTADTSGGVIYGIDDFINAPLASKMDQPTGWGLAVGILLVLGIIIAAKRMMREETRWLNAALLLWFAFCMAGVEGNALPLKMMPHRFWVFLAIPTAILAGYGVVKALEYVEKNKKGLDLVVKVVVVAALLVTAAYPKSIVETSQWPPGASWASTDQLAGYVKLKDLPANTKVFGFCMGDAFADGMDKSGYPWLKDVNDYKTRSISDSVDGNYAFLKKYGYEYAVIDQGCLKTFTVDQVNARLTALGSDSRFTLEQQLSNGAFITLKVS